MRSIFSLFILSVALLGCSNAPSPEPISQVNVGTQVVLQSETNNHEVIQEFDIDNCDGKADATRIERRSSSIDVTISTELAARIGASAQVISADVQAAVGTELSIGGERETSIELKAPPNTHMFFQLAWVGKSRIGVVQNVSGSNIPVAFQSFSPDNVRIKSQYDIGCRNTPVPTIKSESETAIAQQVPLTGDSVTSFCHGNCWQYDDTAKTMTWIKPADGTEDVWQPPGEALQKIREGYTAIFSTSVPGEIFACILNINGQVAKSDCDGVLYQIPPGSYQIISANRDIGGFRWCPETRQWDCK